MDWDGIKNIFLDTLFGEYRSIKRKAMVTLGAIALIYYFGGDSKPQKDIANEAPIETSKNNRWKSLGQAPEAANERRSPASVRETAAQKRRDRTRAQRADKEERSGYLGSVGSRGSASTNSRYPSNSDTGSSNRQWVPMSEYTPSRVVDTPSPESSSGGDDNNGVNNNSIANPVPGGPGLTGSGGIIGPGSRIKTKESKLTCAFDKAEGTYGAGISVGISCSEGAKIFYCVQLGGGHCSPSTGEVYSTAINLNFGDNQYGISFYAESNSSGQITDVKDGTYIIDSTLPDLIVDFPIIQSQTTRLPLLNSTQSYDFGKAYNYYSQVNLKSYNPAGISCRDIFDGHSLYSPTPTVIQTSFDVQSLDPSLDQIDQSVGINRLAPGDNYIVTFIEDQERDLVSCQTQKVIVRDFQIAAFTSTGSTPVVSGVRKIAGGFVEYGHFQSDPLTPTTSGQGQNSGNGLVTLASNLWNIIF